MKKKCNPGVGLRSTHFPHLEEILDQPSSDKKSKIKINWFEALSENYMQSDGRPRLILEKIRRDYPVALHGVSMNLLSTEGLNNNYLKTLKKLIDEIDPFMVSDHLCWTGSAPSNIHDLLPFPFTKDALSTVVDNINYAQDFLQRSLLIENVSTYMTFKNSEVAEWDFLLDVVSKTDSKLLLDINNIYVSAKNHHYDPNLFIDAIPAEFVGQIHLAGYTDMGDFLFDTHSKPVYPEVWKLFERFIKKAPNVPFMMEWDEDIPSFDEVQGEVLKGVELWHSIHGDNND